MFGRIINLLKGAYGGISTSVWLISLAQLINRSGTMVVFFLSVYLRDELHFTLAQVGVVMGLFGAGSLTGTFIGGKLIDKIGYYRVMLGSLLAGGLMFLVVAQISTYVLLCIGIFLLGAFADAFRPANMAAISYYTKPENYTRSISLNRFAINLGFSIGPALGGFLASVNYSWIFYADGITCILAAGLVFFFLENRRNTPLDPSQHVNSGKVASPYRDKLFLMFLPMVMLYAISFFQFFSTMPLYYTSVENLSEIQIGWLMALNGLLVAGIEMVLIFKIEKRWSLYNFIAIGALLIVLSYISLLFLGGYGWLVVVTVVISFSEMLAMPFMNTYMNSRSVLANKGQYASLYSMAWSGAQILTPVLATQVIRFGGYDTLWIVLAGLAIIVLIGILWLKKLSGQNQESRETKSEVVRLT